jgi:hypothetical protein
MAVWSCRTANRREACRIVQQGHVPRKRRWPIALGSGLASHWSRPPLRRFRRPSQPWGGSSAQSTRPRSARPRAPRLRGRPRPRRADRCAAWRGARRPECVVRLGGGSPSPLERRHAGHNRAARRCPEVAEDVRARGGTAICTVKRTWYFGRMDLRRSAFSPSRLAAAVGFLLGLALSDGCGGGGGAAGCGGCGVSNEDFCAYCAPGENVYGCDVPSTNDRICAIDDVTALGLCPQGSNATLLAVCPNVLSGTGGQDGGGADGAQGGTTSTPPPGVDESASGSATAGAKP